MSRFCFFFFVVSFFFVPTLAVSQPPALATVKAVPAAPSKPGGAVTLIVSVTPRPGIHIYAPPQKEFKPISLSVEAAPGVKVGKAEFPAAVTRTFDGEPIKVYDKAFSIAVPVVLPRTAASPAWVKAKLLYQACDDLVCYRPITADLRWDIPLQ